jgi:hypothetical protein
VDSILIRTPATTTFSWGSFVFTFTDNFAPSDSISKYRGDRQQYAMFREQLSENPSQYYLPGNGYYIIPDSGVEWSVADPDGNPTALATIDGAGMLRATGFGDGRVKVRVALSANPDITAERVILIENQGAKDGSRWIQAEGYHEASGFSTAMATYAAGGNEMGMYAAATIDPAAPQGATRAMYKNVDLGYKSDGFYLRYASTAETNVSIWIDGYSEPAKRLGSAVLPPTGSVNEYRTVGLELDETAGGVHDVYLVFGASAPGNKEARVNWFQFNESFQVSFDSGLGENPESQLVPAGGKAAAPTEPTYSGHRFLGWFKAGESEPFDFAGAEINGNLELTARWDPPLPGITLSEAEGQATAEYLIVNAGAEDAEFNCIIAIYDKKGRMVDFKAETREVSAGASVSVSLERPLPEGMTAKAFLWDAKYLPLCDAKSINR